MLVDGWVIDGSCYLGLVILGKMLVIFGDIVFCLQVLEMVCGVDVMVYEIIFEQVMVEKVNSCGYFFSQQIVVFVKEVGVGMLIVIYFSLCYDVEGCLCMLVECWEIFFNMLLVEDFMVYKMV